MQIPDPYKWLPDSAQWPALVSFMMLSAGLLIAMQFLDGPLRTEVSPDGIVSMEFEKNYEQARQIINSWGPRGRVYAALSIGLDYLFLVVYALFISLCCVKIAKLLKYRLTFFSSLGLLLGWAQFIAAFLDAVENFALIHLILDSSVQIWPLVARWCAIFKFGIVGAGLLYIAVGILLTILIKRFRSIRK